MPSSRPNCTRERWKSETGSPAHSKIANPPGHFGVIASMNANLVDTKFARIGARLKIAETPTRRNRTSGPVSLDVQADRKGEFFEIFRAPDAETEIAVLDVRASRRP